MTTPGWLETRQPFVSATMPTLCDTQIGKVREFLQKRYGMKRPPRAAAAMLVLVYELWRQGEPWPTRRTVADHIGMSVYGLDGALSVATARKLIALFVHTTDGAVTRRESVVKLRYYTPSPLLIMAIEC